MNSITIFLFSIIARIIKGVDGMFAEFRRLILHKYQKSLFLINGLNPGGVVFIGLAQLSFERGCKVSIGDNFRCFSGRSRGISTDSCSKITIMADASLKIGNQVGITNTSIICTDSVSIGNHTIIGAGSMIIDSNFHDIHWKARKNRLGVDTAVHKPILIGDDCFIGTKCIICKGVTIGERSVIAAGSVVVTDVPADEVWGGNPAKFIKKLEHLCLPDV